jgi:hypothetical protein
MRWGRTEGYLQSPLCVYAFERERERSVLAGAKRKIVSSYVNYAQLF